MHQIYIGIDGGLGGALVAMQNQNILELIMMPTIQSTKNKKEYDILEIVNFFQKYSTATVILEKAHALPMLGTVQSFRLGQGFGMMMGILSALKMKYLIVHPKTWQKEMFRDINYKDTKQASILIAQRLFPNADFKATKRCKKINDGKTDATLICCYGQRHNF